MFPMILISLAFNAITSVNGAQIYQYETPLVSLKVGRGWIVNGNFKLVHIINLDEYVTVTVNISSLVRNQFPPSRNKEFILHHLTQIQDRLGELMNTKRRAPRSIDWIGSAWKWVAGSPDAADWNKILMSQENIIANNNEQYKINIGLQQATDQLARKINEVIARLNNVTSGRDYSLIEQITINEVIILKDEVNEIVRACQLAKNDIINTNLLDHTEISRIIDEMETLPYGNVIEAVEYGAPSVYTNGSVLLYVLSIPKLGKGAYNMLLTRAAVREGKQVDLKFTKVLLNEEETYGVSGDCLSINNSTVCQKSSVTKLMENDCLSRILKGGSAKCRYRLNQAEIVEVLTDDVIYITNFFGPIKINGKTEILNGTYLLQISNEAVTIKNITYSSTAAVKAQALPPVLVNVTHDDLLLDIKYVHDISLRNINHLEQLDTRFSHSFGISMSTIGLMAICVGWIWYQLTKKLNLPTILPTVNSAICGTQIFKEGGVNNTVDTADKQYSAESA